MYGNDDAATGVHQSPLPAGHAFTPAASGDLLPWRPTTAIR